MKLTLTLFFGLVAFVLLHLTSTHEIHGGVGFGGMVVCAMLIAAVQAFYDDKLPAEIRQIGSTVLEWIKIGLSIVVLLATSAAIIYAFIWLFVWNEAVVVKALWTVVLASWYCFLISLCVFSCFMCVIGSIMAYHLIKSHKKVNEYVNMMGVFKDVRSFNRPTDG